MNKKTKSLQAKQSQSKRSKMSAQQPAIKKSPKKPKQAENILESKDEVEKAYVDGMRAILMQQKKNPKKALEDAENLATIYQDKPDLLLMLAELQQNQGQSKLARETVKKCKALNRMSINTALSLSRLMTTLGLEKEALAVAKKVYLNHGEPLQLATKVLLTATSACDWDLIEKITNRLLNHYKSDGWKRTIETPRTHLLWCQDEAINNRVFQYFAQSLYPKWTDVKPIPKPLKNRKIKLGYMSSDYRNHPTAQLIKGLIRSHQRDEFEIIAYDTGYDDKSDLRKETLDLFDRVVLLNEKSDDEATDILKNDGLDAIIELNGLTNASRMGILKDHPVPIQIAYLGFPGSVGGRFMDYVIADSYVIPTEKEEHYAEKIIRIEKTYQANDHLYEKWPTKVDKNQFGFPGDVIVFGMFNNANKISRETWVTWMAIMKQVPNSVLWILKPNEAAQDNLRKGALQEGVNPNRLIFADRLERQKHYQRVAACDVVLDPWPYGGHTTTSDALFAGVPVVTLEGNNFASRVSSGLIIAAGLPGLVAKTKEEYILGVVNLSKNYELLQKAKDYLIKNRDKLSIFNSDIKARQLETAIKTIINRRLEGLPDISVNASY